MHTITIEHITPMSLSEPPVATAQVKISNQNEDLLASDVIEMRIRFVYEETASMAELKEKILKLAKAALRDASAAIG